MNHQRRLPHPKDQLEALQIGLRRKVQKEERTTTTKLRRRHPGLCPKLCASSRNSSNCSSNNTRMAAQILWQVEAAAMEDAMITMADVADATTVTMDCHRSPPLTAVEIEAIAVIEVATHGRRNVSREAMEGQCL